MNGIAIAFSIDGKHRLSEHWCEGKYYFLICRFLPDYGVWKIFHRLEDRRLATTFFHINIEESK